jgi:hypothetical protein
MTKIEEGLEEGCRWEDWGICQQQLWEAPLCSTGKLGNKLGELGWREMMLAKFRSKLLTQVEITRLSMQSPKKETSLRMMEQTMDKKVRVDDGPMERRG